MAAFYTYATLMACGLGGAGHIPQPLEQSRYLPGDHLPGAGVGRSGVSYRVMRCRPHLDRPTLQLEVIQVVFDRCVEIEADAHEVWFEIEYLVPAPKGSHLHPRLERPERDMHRTKLLDQLVDPSIPDRLAYRLQHLTHELVRVRVSAHLTQWN